MKAIYVGTSSGVLQKYDIRPYRRPTLVSSRTDSEKSELPNPMLTSLHALDNTGALISRDADGMIRTYAAESLRTESIRETALAFSNLLTCASQMPVVVWDEGESLVVARWEDGDFSVLRRIPMLNQVNQLSLSHDGLRLAVLIDGSLSIPVFSTATGKPDTEMTFSELPTAIAFSSTDGRCAVADRGGQLHIRSPGQNSRDKSLRLDMDESPAKGSN